MESLLQDRSQLESTPADFPAKPTRIIVRQVQLIPSLFHLQPPESAGKFWLERFSPYFSRPHEYGVRITGLVQRMNMSTTRKRSI